MCFSCYADEFRTEQNRTEQNRTEQNRTERYNWIDSLKGWAIIGVFLIHSCGSFNVEQHISKIISFGARACQLFFVISAFFIFKSLEKNFGSDYSKISLKNSAKWIFKKILRFVPLYYIALIVFTLTGHYSAYWLGSQGRISVGNFIFHLLFLHGLSPYYINSILSVEWYLADLALFVLVSPILYFFVRSFTGALWGFVISLITAFAFNEILGRIHLLPAEDLYLLNTFRANFGFFAQLPVMFLGIIFYFLVKKIEKFRKSQDGKSLSLLILLASLFMLIGLIFKNSRIFGINNFTLYGIVFFGICLSQWLYPCFLIDNPFFRLFGKYSYPLFLFNFLIIDCCKKIPLPDFAFSGSQYILIALTMIKVLSVGLLFSVLATKFIEKPFRRLF